MVTLFLSFFLSFSLSGPLAFSFFLVDDPILICFWNIIKVKGMSFSCSSPSFLPTRCTSTAGGMRSSLVVGSPTTST